MTTNSTRSHIDIARERQAVADASRAALEALRPAGAQALIVAELEQDECDMMTDYFATSISRVVALAWSKHTRNVFSEMRKAAAKFAATEHLGPGCDVYTAHVVLTCDVPNSNGAAYWTGSTSHWHGELDGGDGRTFTTQAAADAFVAAAPAPEPIYFGEQLVTFDWCITRQSVEHREDYSMGAGLYLKAAGCYSSGWKVRKVSVTGHGGSAMDLAILTGGTPATVEPAAALEAPALEAAGADAADAADAGPAAAVVELEAAGAPAPGVVGAIAAAPACGRPIDAQVPGSCERAAGHGGPCRAYSLETDAPPAPAAPAVLVFDDFCARTLDHQHQPDPTTVTAAAGAEWIVDIWCRACGRSGSVRIDPSAIAW